MVWDLGGGFEALIQPARRCTTRGHVCKFCVYYKNQDSLGDYVRYLLLFYHVRPANQPKIADVALWYKNVAHPCFEAQQFFHAHRLNIQKFYILFTKCNSVVRISEKTPIISTQLRVAFITERQCVYHALRAETLKIITLIITPQSASHLPLSAGGLISLPDEFMSDLWSTG